MAIDVLLRRLRHKDSIIGRDEWERRALHLESKFGHRRYRTALNGLENYCFFIGYLRSGHILIGAMLDVHPQVVRAHELGVIKFINAGFNGKQIEYLLIENSRRCTVAGHSRGSFDYHVAG